VNSIGLTEILEEYVFSMMDSLVTEKSKARNPKFEFFVYPDWQGVRRKVWLGLV
jgi:hypothetical protein